MIIFLLRLIYIHILELFQIEHNLTTKGLNTQENGLSIIDAGTLIVKGQLNVLLHLGSKTMWIPLYLLIWPA